MIDEDVEELGDEEEDNVFIDPVKLANEISELESYRTLALKIGKNAKGGELVNALPKAMDQIVEKGGMRKAVIFTESVRTQKYLADLLSAAGYADEIVLLNGQNADSASRTIYKDWLARHHGTEAISGSKTADMKAAVVEAFRERKAILIATESGAEGINLQFCSLVINYDLPWNPQRVEQRIGRCHRYGQKIDVSVVNFLNLKNRAEQRVYELLSEKFRLFDGVFGASDEVLGAIERGVDIERRILEIVQHARNETEINTAFDKLQADLQEQISDQVLDARKRLLENVDEKVIRQLKTRDGEIRRYLSDFDRYLLLIAKAELPNANFHSDDERRFDYEGKTYTTEWPVADERGWQFFRMIEGTLAPVVIAGAKTREFSSAGHLRFDLSGYPGRLADVETLRGSAGWLRVAKLRSVTPTLTREQLVVSVLSDNGQPTHPDTIERLMSVPALDVGDAENIPEAELAVAESQHRKALIDALERQNEAWLDAENEKLDAYAEDLERAFEADVKALEADIKAAKRELRGSTFPLNEKLAAKRKISTMETRRDNMKADYFERRAAIRAEVEVMLDKIQESLRIVPTMRPLFTIRWEIT